LIQIDGLHVGDHVLVAAIGNDAAGDKHVLALTLGATENAAVVKALLADLIERGLPDRRDLAFTGYAEHGEMCAYRVGDIGRRQPGLRPRGRRRS